MCVIDISRPLDNILPINILYRNVSKLLWTTPLMSHLVSRKRLYKPILLRLREYHTQVRTHQGRCVILWGITSQTCCIKSIDRVFWSVIYCSMFIFQYCFKFSVEYCRFCNKISDRTDYSLTSESSVPRVSCRGSYEPRRWSTWSRDWNNIIRRSYRKNPILVSGPMPPHLLRYLSTLRPYCSLLTSLMFTTCTLYYNN